MMLIDMDVFYKIPKRKAERILRDAQELSTVTFLERKDETYKRVKCDITFDEMLRVLLNTKNHLVFIERTGGFSITTPKGEITSYYEVGGCTMNGPFDYFLFIYLEPENGNSLISKYKLKKLRCVQV